MLKRIALLLIVLTSLFWLTYVFSDIMSDTNRFEPEELFGAKDGELLIIHDNKLVPTRITNFESSPSAKLYTSLLPNSCQIAFISKNRSHLLLIGKNPWTQEQLDELFGGSDKHQEGLYKDYQFRLRKNNLYLWKGDLSYQDSKDEFRSDLSADATLITFLPEEGIERISDLYQNQQDVMRFVTHLPKNGQHVKGRQVNDRLIFSAFLSSDIQQYHFLERDFLSVQDPIFAKNPLFRWCESGVIRFNYLGEDMLLSDFVEGQDPLLVLQEINQNYDTLRFDTQLIQGFPASGRSYCVRTVENMVVIGYDESRCDQFIADYKLGKTIAQNKTSFESIYGTLPSKVSERKITKNGSLSRSVYQNKLIETHSGRTEKINLTDKEPQEKTNISLAVGSPIKDFKVLPGVGNVIVLTTTGKLMAFTNSKLKWKVDAKGDAIGELELIDLFANGDFQVMWNSSDKLYVIDSKGSPVKGFPVDLELAALSPAKHYRWNNKGYFLIGTESGLLHFDQLGKRITLLKSKGPVRSNISVWLSNRIPFAGYKSGGTFHMIDIEKRQSFREFALQEEAIEVKIPNEIIHFVTVDGDLRRIDQKGQATLVGKIGSGQLFAIDKQKEPMLVLRDGRKLSVLNGLGNTLIEITLSFDEIADLSIFSDSNGKTTFAVVDGLENNVYLYRPENGKLNMTQLEGASKVVLSESKKGLLLTTMMDQYIVQYFEN